MNSLSLTLDRAAEIIITDELVRRPDRTADLRCEADAFLELSRAIVADPKMAIQRFLEVAMALCDADAAGISMPDYELEKPLFRWDALAGVYAEFVGGTVPLDHSPCGLARACQQPIVVSRPGRVYPEFAAVNPAIEEGLIVPFYDNGRRFLGTIWVVHTRPGRQFCANDLRVMEQLAVQMVLAFKLLDEQAGTREIQQMLTKSRAGRSADSFGHASRNTDNSARSPFKALREHVSYLVETSAFLNSVLGSSNDCIKVLDLTGRIEFVNEGGLRLLAAPDIDAMRGRMWQDAWEGTERQLADEAVQQAVRGAGARFQGTSPTFAGEDRFWDVQITPIRHPGETISYLLAVSRDITDQRRNEQQLELLAKELDHRVKNILAMVVAIAHQTLRPPATLEDAANAFGARVAALGRAQSILTNASWENADIHRVVDGALAAHRSDEEDGRFIAVGPAYSLSASRAFSLALALHELATNATKYGALSREGGTVAISWSVTDEGFDFFWVESGGPPVEQPRHRGFGSRLIERALAAEFRGRVRIEFASEGLSCHLTAPL